MRVSLEKEVRVDGVSQQVLRVYLYNKKNTCAMYLVPRGHPLVGCTLCRWPAVAGV